MVGPLFVGDGKAPVTSPTPLPVPLSDSAYAAPKLKLLDPRRRSDAPIEPITRTSVQEEYARDDSVASTVGITLTCTTYRPHRGSYPERFPSI
jgi:hypothetical protein